MMTSTNRYSELLKFLGLARRAGKLTIGFDNIKKERMIIYSAFCSDRTIRKIADMKVPAYRIDLSMTEIGESLGVGECGVVAMSDTNFIKKTKELLDSLSD